jgi:small GTP-binding protein
MTFFIREQTEPTTVISPATAQDGAFPATIPHYKIVVMGDQYTGKSALIHRICHGEYKPDLLSQLGMNYHNPVFLMQDNPIKLLIWDACGNKRFRSLMQPYIPKKDAFIICFDLNDTKTFNNLQDWLTLVESSSHEKRPAIVLVGTKADLDERLITDEQIESFMSEWNLNHPGWPIAGYVETSTKSGKNVNVLIEKVLQSISNDYQLTEIIHAKGISDRRTQLQDSLDKFIGDTGRKKDEHGNFTEGLGIFSQARAYNRETSYLIARQIRDEMAQGAPLGTIFNATHLLETQERVMSQSDYLKRGNPGGFFSRSYDISRGSLGPIWEEGVNLARETLRKG